MEKPVSSIPGVSMGNEVKKKKSQGKVLHYAGHDLPGSDKIKDSDSCLNFVMRKDKSEVVTLKVRSQCKK
jgi:hypothetical protein